jgi:hypothetical protein
MCGEGYYEPTMVQSVLQPRQVVTKHSSAKLKIPLATIFA